MEGKISDTIFSLSTMERVEQVSNHSPMASQIEREAEADLVPGTEVMTAVDGARSDNQDSIVLIPQPTNDPHDPLVSFIQPLSLSFSKSSFTLFSYTLRLGLGRRDHPHFPAISASLRKEPLMDLFRANWYLRTGVPCGKLWLLSIKASSL